MKYIVFVFVLAVFVSCSEGLKCYTCSSYDFDGEASRTGYCFKSNATTPSSTCGVGEYCRTMFTLDDGVVSGVDRGCYNPTFDEDDNSNTMPTKDKCTTTFRDYGDDTASTNCYIHCNADKCNDNNPSGLKACTSNCNYNNNGGECDYITGKCRCNAGFTGSKCDSASTSSYTPRNCVQCNSETNSACSSSTSSVDCPGSQRYCSTTRSVIYDEDGNIVQTVLTRGCTNNWEAVDRCTFSDIYSDGDYTLRDAGYREFTCFSTCSTNGCNTNLPDGLRNNNEKPVLHCHQCDSTSGSSCGSSPTPCSSSATHCKATVVYMISERTDLSYTDDPDYELVSEVRECATEATTATCTETQLGDFGVKRVVCEETCQQDGCNSGWPARPKCLQCSSRNVNSYSECIENPDPAEDCDYPYQKFCVISDNGIERDRRVGVTGYPRQLTRWCSHYNVGTGCVSETIRGTSVENCNRTCSTDGCNVGGGSSMPVQTFFALVIPTLLGWLTQNYY